MMQLRNLFLLTKIQETYSKETLVLILDHRRIDLIICSLIGSSTTTMAFLLFSGRIFCVQKLKAMWRLTSVDAVILQVVNTSQVLEALSELAHLH